jgi:hypothetical protein
VRRRVFLEMKFLTDFLASSSEARLEMSFDEFQVKSSEISVTYQLPNLIAELGGLLGLFMGCSLLSIIELFYFCFASIVFIGKRRAAKKSEEKEVRCVLPTYMQKLYFSELKTKHAALNNFQREFAHKVNFSYHN